MKLAEWARANGVHPQTAYRWFREDRMPVAARRLESGTIWVDAAADAGQPGRAVVYARVSSHDQRADLDRQVARLAGWATSNGHEVGEVVTEVGSGLNGKRPKLRRVLSDPSVSVIVVEHRDRLARFGVEHLEAALSAHGRRVIVADRGETTDDLVRDMIEVLTSMCARLYGRRGARNRAMRAVTATKHAEGVGDG
ncbi:integrase [Mycobacterium avium subsp. hominissuis]|uniref:Integrase n=1 Tax=Mycobacterium avium subsp. hominissuis TaxID=439334 RepID=A0A2A3LES8_MYCAV|nr:IS607 family transposase [Mycobacterium avium]PBA08411.1 integrase [Mycobacterium avium]PBJ41359.1 integrase [Mycobacterium avium subsp. hominissuis]PBJ65553.1 integrase [Mycobacterium avium subsp. hominissuis]